jgi:hypothetical protein
MNEVQARFYTQLTCFLSRFPKWFLVEDSLIDFLVNRKVASPLHIAIDDLPQEQIARITESCQLMTKNVAEGVYAVAMSEFMLYLYFPSSDVAKKLKPEDIYAPEEVVDYCRSHRKGMTHGGLWTKQIFPEYPYMVNLPYKYGTVADICKPLWFKDIGKRDLGWLGQTFFVGKRVENGAELLSTILDVGKSVNIEHAMWLGFGCCLGYVMCGGFIPKDHDIDMCINGDLITRDQEEAFIAEIQKPRTIAGKHYEHGLCEKRFQPPSRRTDNGRVLWTSIGHRSIQFDNGVKACHWFWFKHEGWAWHSKGARWVNAKKFNQSDFQYSQSDEALCLGIPQNLIEKFVYVDFEGVRIKIPYLAGSCCDWWYPGWDAIGEGSSAKQIVLAVGKWADKRTWRIA